ncbi:MAG: GNAT family N-acetyltransferase [Spirochaetales bacterium]|nr:GNAT family N-acetyltransferase [Spirochaetales bacterium]
MESIVPFAGEGSLEEINELYEIITQSFRTVADDFGFTRENAPANPAFRPKEDLVRHIERGGEYFFAVDNGRKVGCVAIEKHHSEQGCFFIERLAVLPEYRHRGYGARLIAHALAEIRKRNGSSAGLGIINDNTVLKDWYIKLGFTVTGTKRFEHLPFTVCFMEMKL